MRNITLSAPDELIERARERARLGNTTLNQAFRNWLADYANRSKLTAERIRETAESAPDFRVGVMPTREERNER